VEAVLREHAAAWRDQRHRLVRRLLDTIERLGLVVRAPAPVSSQALQPNVILRGVVKQPLGLSEAAVEDEVAALRERVLQKGGSWSETKERLAREEAAKGITVFAIAVKDDVLSSDDVATIVHAFNSVHRDDDNITRSVVPCSFDIQIHLGRVPS
jgi:hypothetical protein